MLIKWSIEDSRFSLLFIFLAHVYKIKFVKLVQERLINRFLDNYNDEKFFANGKSTLIKAIFVHIESELKSITKLKIISIFNSIYLEALSKIFFFLFLQLSEMIQHEDFELKPINLALLTDEIALSGDYIKRIQEQSQKEFNIKDKVFNKITRKTYLEHFQSKMIESCIQRFKNMFREYFSDEIKSAELSSVKLNAIFKSIEEKMPFISSLQPARLEIYQKESLDCFVEIFNEFLLSRSKNELNAQMTQIRDQVLAVCKWSFNKIDTTHETYFYAYLCDFLTSDDRMKAWKALALCSNLLRKPLKKSQLFKLIDLKVYPAKNDFRLHLEKSVVHHFESLKNLKATLNLHERSNRLLNVFIVTLLFIIKMKRKRTVLGTTAKFGALKDTIDVQEKVDDVNLLADVKRVKVRYQLITKRLIKQRFKGLPATTMLAKKGKNAGLRKGLFQLRGRKVFTDCQRQKRDQRVPDLEV